MGAAEGRVSATTASYAHCRAVARTRARNFYYAFVLLDRQRRDSLCAIYAFMRHCDDLSDDAGATAAALDAWRDALVRSLNGTPPPDPLWPAFLDTVERSSIPHAYFHDMIHGVASDLGPVRMNSFDELYRYCYRVASVAGLSLTHIFGRRDPEALGLAEKCGIAFQLTNIIRDVKEDAAAGRVYLPREDMDRLGVTDADLNSECASDALRRLLRFEASRAARYYEESRPLIRMVDRECQASLWALIEIYSKLLARIEARKFNVMAGRIRLPAAAKLAILARAMLH